MARLLIALGIVLLLVGVLLQLTPGLFSWFGKLPGDIHIETERSRVFIPITSMILISVILSLAWNLISRL